MFRSHFGSKLPSMADKEDGSAWGGDPHDLAMKLLEFVAKEGINFCKYPVECKNTKDATLVESAIPADHDLLVILRKEHTNLHFKKTTMLEVIDVIQAKLSNKNQVEQDRQD